MEISALDESGQKVDWWFIYKVPQLGLGGNNGTGNNQNNDSATGYEYVYYDSTIDANPDPRQRIIAKSNNLINLDQGALDRTLDSVFNSHQHPDPTTGWIIYNDEYPASVGKHDDAAKGHSKGVLAFDTETKTGYWLLHSWPKYIDPEATTYPTPKYGQTYLCISLDLDSINKIAALMVNHQEPQIYDCNIADIPKEADQPLYVLTQPLTSSPAPSSTSIDLQSAGVNLPAGYGKLPFKVIAKNREWNDDFWNDLVGPTLGDDMDDETWIRGKIPPIADSDGIHKTFDIKYINLGPLGAHWAWPETSDHAKWGITLHEQWICIADINRMVSQRKRGGGGIAFQNTILWSALSKTSLVLAPPATSRTDTAQLIMDTQHPNYEAPLKPQQAPGLSSE